MTAVSELWLKYRPSSLDGVIGQESAVSMLTSYVRNKKIPHAILMTGPSGCGKSSCAQIIADELGCFGIDRVVINCATVDKPLESIKSLESQVKLSPGRGSNNRIWILEEVQSLTRSNAARQAILLMMESTSKATRKSYLIACTTDPQKLDVAIRTRFKKIEFNTLSEKDMRKLLSSIAEKEGREVPEPVLDKIIDASDGSAREAVNQLDSALNAGDDEESMLKVVSGVKSTDGVYKLFQALLWTKPKWNAVVPIIKSINEDPEKFRRSILKMAAGEMLKGERSADRAFYVHAAFQDSWESCPDSGLVSSCREVVKQFGVV